MFASQVKNKKIAIIESNAKIGQKIKISGGAKCNITNENVSFKNYLGDKEFVKNVKPLVKSVMAGHNDNAITELKTISKSNETIKESTFDYTYSENRALLKKALDLIAKKKGKLALGLLNKISQKDPHASYLIAKILYEGIGIKKNKASAIKWFKKSAKKEFPSAVEYLSKL